jgi:hypothetical protein
LSPASSASAGVVWPAQNAKPSMPLAQRPRADTNAMNCPLLGRNNIHCRDEEGFISKALSLGLLQLST